MGLGSGLSMLCDNDSTNSYWYFVTYTDTCNEYSPPVPAQRWLRKLQYKKVCHLASLLRLGNPLYQYSKVRISQLMYLGEEGGLR